jgi:hypothetical protein
MALARLEESSKFGVERRPVVLLVKAHDKHLVRVVRPAKPHCCLSMGMIIDDIEQSRASAFAFLVSSADAKGIIVFVLPESGKCLFGTVEPAKDVLHTLVAGPRVRQGIDLFRIFTVVKQAVVGVHQPTIRVEHLLLDAGGGEFQTECLVRIAHHDKSAGGHSALLHDTVIGLGRRGALERHAEGNMRRKSGWLKTLKMKGIVVDGDSRTVKSNLADDPSLGDVFDGRQSGLTDRQLDQVLFGGGKELDQPNLLGQIRGNGMRR